MKIFETFDDEIYDEEQHTNPKWKASHASESPDPLRGPLRSQGSALWGRKTTNL